MRSSWAALGLLLAASCTLDTPNPHSDTTPKPQAIHVTTRWTAVGGGDSNQSMTLADGVIYWADNVLGTAGATDSASGRRIWLNSQVGASESNPLVTDLGVWLFLSPTEEGLPWRIALLDKADGHRITTVAMPDSSFRLRAFTWIRSGKWLIWHGFEQGLVALNLDRIDFSVATQTLAPEVLWPGSYDSVSIPIEARGKLYFQLRKSSDTVTPKEEGDDFIVWKLDEMTLVKRLVSTYSGANMHSPPSLYGGKIYYQDWNAIRCIDPATDEFAFAELPRNVDLASGIGFGFYGDKLYFSNSNGSTTVPGYDKNLVCRSTVDGHLVWKVAADDYSLGARPVVKDGILYILSQTGLKLFNANTGALLGYDKRYQAGGGDLFDNTLDDGTYLYPRSMGHIVAIKMDWKLDAHGRLTRGSF